MINESTKMLSVQEFCRENNVNGRLYEVFAEQMKKWNLSNIWTSFFTADVLLDRLNEAKEIVEGRKSHGCK